MSLYFLYFFVRIDAGVECHRNYESIYCAFTMYATYFILFAKLFKDAYLTKKPKTKKSD